MPSLPDIDSPHTAFRRTEKHFKSRVVKYALPSLRTLPVLDLSRPDDHEDDEVWKAGWWGPQDVDSLQRLRKGKERERGERPDLDVGLLKSVRQVTLEDGDVGWVVAPGCILIPQYLSPSQQLQLSQSALEQYTLPPNPLSLSAHYVLPPNLFHLHSIDSPLLIKPIYSTLSEEEKERALIAQERAGGNRTMVDTKPEVVVDFEDVLEGNRINEGIIPSSKAGLRTAKELMKELRWANLGWVYQWSTKSYDFTNPEPIPFPTPLAQLCTNIVKSIPWSEVYKDSKDISWKSWKEDYVPDTGIVNFYQLKDTLMGHVDRAELDPSRPLVSISLGHSTIFLLGSSTRNDQPIPLILRSGDILIMSGPGRKAYHGVPRIMEGTLPSHFTPSSDDSLSMKTTKEFLQTARININARQVFPPGFVRPNPTPSPVVHSESISTSSTLTPTSSVSINDMITRCMNVSSYWS
ncbi:alkylated DNA repair protein AlkB [Tremella mesenterica]|uniref:Alkylated DNA repair protein AlkB n=1 Tax=Tremella mesenterica TaxID=5217 RepID=A0A4Q1BQR2_TREME|nr:alkylated DNA repair protein AlkB [Tremella mesenterica]